MPGPLLLRRRPMWRAINAAAAHVGFECRLRISTIDAKRENIFRRKIVELRAFFAVGEERRQIDEEQVRFLAGIERPDRSRLAEGPRPAARGEIKRFTRAHAGK